MARANILICSMCDCSLSSAATRKRTKRFPANRRNHDLYTSRDGFSSCRVNLNVVGRIATNDKQQTSDLIGKTWEGVRHSSKQTRCRFSEGREERDKITIYVFLWCHVASRNRTRFLPTTNEESEVIKGICGFAACPCRPPPLPPSPPVSIPASRPDCVAFILYWCKCRRSVISRRTFPLGNHSWWCRRQNTCI